MPLHRPVILLLGGLLWLSCSHLSAQDAVVELVPTFAHQVVTVNAIEDTSSFRIIQDCNLYEEQWDTLAQPMFWCKIMQLHKDLSLVNIAATREVLGMVETARIDSMTREELDDYKDSVRQVHGIDKEEKVYVTSGKSDFYQFKRVMPDIGVAIDVFQEEKVDPWYAQAILLIESPSRLEKSHVGAYGKFQLMKSVAIEQGLKVNRYVDEREDLQKSAAGAARLLRNVCIPRTKAILDGHNVKYDENEIWFRLMVLHVYHAGYRNVYGVVNKIRPKQGDMSLIQKVWKTEHRRFGNSSQNYSQLILASLMKLDQLVYDEFEILCDCCN